MNMPGRTYSSGSSSYRYGFNGKEQDKEATSTTTYDYGFRIYSPALGRFLSVDPLSPKYPMLTPYQFASNTPIRAIDLDGLEAVTFNTPPDKAYKSLVIIIQGYIGTNPADGKTQAQNDVNSDVDVNGIAYPTEVFKNQPDIKVVVFSSSQSENTKTDVATTINNFKAMNPNGKVVIAGHSLGADNAVELVNENKTLDIDLLVTLDIADTYDDDNIPSNVKVAINFYQTNDFPGGEQIEIDDKKKTRGYNIEAKNSTHTSIDNDLRERVTTLLCAFAGGNCNGTDGNENKQNNSNNSRKTTESSNSKSSGSKSKSEDSKGSRTLRKTGGATSGG